MRVWEYIFVHFSPVVLQEAEAAASEPVSLHEPLTLPNDKNIVPLALATPWENERGQGVALYINNERQRVEKGDGEGFTYACFAELGQQGWELAAIEYGRYIFKRPKSSSRSAPS